MSDMCGDQVIKKGTCSTNISASSFRENVERRFGTRGCSAVLSYVEDEDEQENTENGDREFRLDGVSEDEDRDYKYDKYHRDDESFDFRARRDDKEEESFTARAPQIEGEYNRIKAKRFVHREEEKKRLNAVFMGYKQQVIEAETNYSKNVSRSRDRKQEFMTELVIHAYNQKLLLADCSGIVSDEAKICLTRSFMNEEYATLVFVIRVANLHKLQRIMERLESMPSVMLVERKLGSEVLSRQELSSGTSCPMRS